jgi:hypothetical protein
MRFSEIRVPLILIVFLYLLYSSLMFARGSVVYLLVGLFLVYLFIGKKQMLLYKGLKLVLPMLLLLIAFDELGNLRQAQSKGLSGGFDILAYGEFNITVPAFFAWFYGYVVINLDNLVLCLRDFSSSSEMRFSSLRNFAPSLFALLAYGENSLVTISQIQTMPYVGRFNLVSAFGFFAYDFGWLGAYGWSLILSILCLSVSRVRADRPDILGDIWFVYLGLSFLFITVGNLIFTSKIVGSLLALFLLRLSSGASMRKLLHQSRLGTEPR